MRIAIISDWFSPRRGGIESQLEQLAAGLAQRGHHVDVLTSTPGASAGDAYHVRRLDVTLLPILDLALSPALPSVLRDELRRGYDVVHAHVSVMSPVGYAAAGVAWSLGLPALVTFHSVLRHKRLVLKLADLAGDLSASPLVWTGVSELVASQLRLALTGATVSVLPNGIDHAFWRSASDRSESRATSCVTLVSTMRLHRKKRPRPLVQSFARAVARAGVPARLVIVGEGPERQGIERDIRELGLDRGTGRVELVGWLAPESLRATYAAADGFVLASTRESFGIAALEAATAGLPVIAMADAGCREFLERGSSLLCRDDEELTDAIGRFVRTAELRVSNARTAELERYDWNSVLTEHEAAYGRAMTRSMGAAAARVAVA